MNTPLRIILARLRVPAVLALISTLLPFLPAQTAATAPPTAAADPITLSPFVVTTEQDKGYGVTHSIGASRINLPVREIPTYSVTINEQFMKDIMALELTEATRFVSGMETTSSGRNGQTTLRGYEVGTANWRDGIPENLSFGGVVFTDMGDTERVEIIKGPSGVLYGSHSMGGLINRVSKQPLSVRRSTVELNVGAGSEDYGIRHGQHRPGRLPEQIPGLPTDRPQTETELVLPRGLRCHWLLLESVTARLRAGCLG